MATIGTFVMQADGSLTGAIHTLGLNVRQAVFKPLEKTDRNSPDFRVFAGRAEIGAAWRKLSRDQTPYVSVKLDDPSLDAPIFASMFEAEEGYDLVWTRSQPQSAIAEAA